MKKQFTFQEFVGPIEELSKGDFFIYPANAYQTIQRIKRIVCKDKRKRTYQDQAVDKTERVFIRTS
jgi:hypothetical protein